LPTCSTEAGWTGRPVAKFEAELAAESAVLDRLGGVVVDAPVGKPRRR
jgi:hypothetical protein